MYDKKGRKYRKGVERLLDNKQLEKEYDQIFDGIEKVLNLLKVSNDAYTREIKIIDIEKIGLSEPTKKGRKDTRLGLTQSIKELGVINPILVMTTEIYGEEEIEVEEGINVYSFTLIDGLRRMSGAYKNGKHTMEAIVLDFKDKEKGRQIALPLGLALSKTQRRTWNEIWELYQILEMQNNFAITPGTLEYLLDLEPGDSMKLKDVMLSGDQEVVDDLIINKKNLEQCYRLLQRHRKEEDSLEKEDNTGISQVEGVADIVAATQEEDAPMLSDQQVMSLLEMVEDIDSISEEDFGAFNSSLTGDERQKVGERHIIDPQIKQATFQKDNFECICCNTGDVAFLGALVYHHKIPVHCGGPDTVENGATLCDTCHIIVHVAEKAGGKLAMTKEQFEAYDEVQQRRIKKILALAKLAVQASQIKKIPVEKMKEEANKSMRHRMPGEGLKEAKIAYADHIAQKA